MYLLKKKLPKYILLNQGLKPVSEKPVRIAVYSLQNTRINTKSLKNQLNNHN